MKIKTQHPIALDSNDHLKPHGTVHDFSDAFAFCKYIQKHWPDKTTMLDLGTGTGTVVETAIKAGMDAYGVEGSDAARKQGLGAWPGLADIRLFNADLRWRFVLGDEREEWINEIYGPTHYVMYPYKFDVITAWDVLEHLSEENIDISMENFVRHSHKDTFVTATIQFDNHNNELYHHLLKPREWWIEKFAEFGFKDNGPSPMLSMVRGVPEVNQFWFVKQ